MLDWLELSEIVLNCWKDFLSCKYQYGIFFSKTKIYITFLKILNAHFCLYFRFCIYFSVFNFSNYCSVSALLEVLHLGDSKDAIFEDNDISSEYAKLILRFSLILSVGKTNKWHKTC